MELPENVRIEWQTITELNNDDLLKFLKEVYQSVRIGSPVAAQMVSLDAVKHMMIIADNDNQEISQYASDITIAAWTFLPRLEREFFCKRWNQEYATDSDKIRALKMNLCTSEIELEDTKKYLINCLKDATVGLAAMEILKDRIEVSYNDIEEMGRNAKDIELLLRVVEIAASKKTPDCQTWAKENLLRCLNAAKNDVLVLMNLFELLERLDACVLSSSMEILFQLRHDPIISSMGMSYCSLVKIYTKYFAFTKNVEMPGWYQDLLISDELEGHFQIASIRFLIQHRNDAEPVFRRNNRLRDLIEENYTRTDWETQIAELLKAILKRKDCNEEIFSYWFLEKFARHYFLLTTQPDLVHRTLGVEVLEAAAKFEKSIAFVQKIDDFASLLTGPGVSDSRISACKKFASHPAFEVAFGEQTTKQWRTAKAGAIEVYDPFVDTMEM